jgi:hypothetical protein
MSSPHVYVVGDPTVDWILHTIPPRGGNASDALASYPNYMVWKQPGGVHLAKTALEENGFSVVLETVPRGDARVLNSLVSIKCLKREGKHEEFVSTAHTFDQPSHARIDRFEGYFERNGTSEEVAAGRLLSAFPFVLVVDAGGATRESLYALGRIESAVGPETWLVHKMHLPLTGPNALREGFRNFDSTRKLLLISADDLRLQAARPSFLGCGG